MLYTLMFGATVIIAQPSLEACEDWKRFVIKQTVDHSEAGRIRICPDVARFVCTRNKAL